MTGNLGSKASDYLVDLTAFLYSTFAIFTHLPGKVAQTACMSACKHLATSLMQLLLEAEVRQLTLGALQQFNLDVRECERKTVNHLCLFVLPAYSLLQEKSFRSVGFWS